MMNLHSIRVLFASWKFLCITTHSFLNWTCYSHLLSLGSSSTVSEETEGECYAGAASLLRGDYTAQGDVMTSRESLYLDGTWATDDDGGWAPEASHPHEGGQELKTKMYLKESEVRLSGFVHCFFGHLELQAAVTQTQRLIWNDLIYLFLHIIISHSAAVLQPPAGTLRQQGSNQ